MTVTGPFQTTLRTRILAFTGAVLVFLLLTISQVLLYQWRDIIVAKERDAVTAVARTFTVTVLDALIREGQTPVAREGMLQTSIDDFMRSLSRVKYVAVVDERRQAIAVGPALSADLIPTIAWQGGHDEGIGTRIVNDPHFAWVIEIHLPLRIGQRSWGSATIGFDAEPIRDEIRRLFFLLFGTTVLVTGATLVVLFVLSSRLTRSLNRLVHEIDSVDLGQETASPPARREDDVAFLFERFDLMQRRIEHSRRQLASAQHQVYQAEKLASIGRLASGIAHQVNNPLNGIRSCLYAIDKEPGNVAQTQEYIALISEAITSIEAVVQKLLGFARQPSEAESRTDVSSLTRKVADLFALRLREKQIHVSLSFPEGLPHVVIDPQLFQEVVMNLLVNSYDAVGPGGRISISARLDEDSTLSLTVADDGIGIPAADLQRIFEPFFTTKEIGKGTGLGLSVCQSIVESHGGRFSVKSEEGNGAVFTVTLPTDPAHERPDH